MINVTGWTALMGVSHVSYPIWNDWFIWKKEDWIYCGVARINYLCCWGLVQSILHWALTTLYHTLSGGMRISPPFPGGRETTMWRNAGTSMHVNTLFWLIPLRVMSAWYIDRLTNIYTVSEESSPNWSNARHCMKDQLYFRFKVWHHVQWCNRRDGGNMGHGPSITVNDKTT